MQRSSLYGVHKRDYQESVTIGQTDARTHTKTDAGQSDPYVPLCFAGDTKSECRADLNNTQKTEQKHKGLPDFCVNIKVCPILSTDLNIYTKDRTKT